jgi:ABC-type amino acid transport substrate-binding protein
MLSSMAIRAICTVAGAGVTLGGLAATSPVRAQASVIEQLVKESHLTKITQSRTLRVCQYPQYYSISFRNPATGQLEGIDADLAKELAKDLGVKLEVVESSFVTFIADLQTNKCDIGMFAVGATLARAKAVEFSKPYLVTSIFGVVKKNGDIRNWADIDKDGHVVAVSTGSYIETFMNNYLQHAKVLSVTPPATREQEVAIGHADVVMTDYPTAIKLVKEFDWASIVEPTSPLAVTPYSYVVAPGDQIWLNYVNQFVDVIKLDGRLKFYAQKHSLDKIVAP